MSPRLALVVRVLESQARYSAGPEKVAIILLTEDRLSTRVVFPAQDTRKNLGPGFTSVLGDTVAYTIRADRGGIDPGAILGEIDSRFSGAKTGVLVTGRFQRLSVA